jgi:hypothetical protein
MPLLASTWGSASSPSMSGRARRMLSWCFATATHCEKVQEQQELRLLPGGSLNRKAQKQAGRYSALDSSADAPLPPHLD